MKIKKILVMLLCMIVITFACGCSNSSTGKKEGNTKPDVPAQTVETDDTTNTPEEVVEDNTNSTNDGSVESQEVIIGILFEGYNPFKNLEFKELVYSEDDFNGKIVSINANIINYVDGHIDDKTRTVIAPDAKSAAIVCSCGSCNYIYFINSANELIKIDLETKAQTKLEDNIVPMAHIDVNLFNDTCGMDYIALKDTQGRLYYRDDIGKTELKELERNNLTFDESVIKSLYIVSENVKVDKYLTDEKNNTLKAKAVVYEYEGKAYVITVDNHIYYFENVFKSTKGKLYKNDTVKSFEEDSNKDLKVEYTNGKQEVIKGKVVINN